MKRDAFRAIADPTRRHILGLVYKKTININALAGNFDVSRTAIYKHIKVLTECGLIVIRQEGRERYCEAKMERLQPVADWLCRYSTTRQRQLSLLENYLQLLIEEEATAEKRKKTSAPKNKQAAAVNDRS